jgi:type IV pilus assembly protein PilZ
MAEDDKPPADEMASIPFDSGSSKESASLSAEEEKSEEIAMESISIDKENKDEPQAGTDKPDVDAEKPIEVGDKPGTGSEKAIEVADKTTEDKPEENKPGESKVETDKPNTDAGKPIETADKPAADAEKPIEVADKSKKDQQVESKSDTNKPKDSNEDSKTESDKPAKKPISLAIKDLKVLYTAYMPFLVNGGLFIPTKKSFEMGEMIPLMISLMDDPTKYAVEGKVIWITPINTHGRTPGIGVQFNGDKAAILSKQIEKILVKYPDSGERTNTM